MGNETSIKLYYKQTLTDIKDKPIEDKLKQSESIDNKVEENPTEDSIKIVLVKCEQNDDKSPNKQIKDVCSSDDESVEQSIKEKKKEADEDPDPWKDYDSFVNGISMS